MKKYKFILLLIIVLLTLTLSNCSSNSFSFDEGIMKVHFIDVGQGDSILIQVNNKNLLIDAGPRDSSKSFLNYIDSLNIKKFDYVIYTHPHEDHIGNMAKLIKRYKISEFYGPKVEHASKDFEKMVESLVDKNLKIKIIKEGLNSIDLGVNTNVTVFSPKEDGYDDNLNEYSVIIKIQYGDNKFLFTGDAEKSNEAYILNKGYDVKADVLKIGHHGSSTSTSEAFYQAVDPYIAVIELGEDNSYNHPHKDTMSLLNKYKSIIYRTDKHGTIILTSDGSTIDCYTSK